MQVELPIVNYEEHVRTSLSPDCFDLCNGIDRLIDCLAKSHELEDLGDNIRIRNAKLFLDELSRILAPGRSALNCIEICKMDHSIAILPERIRDLTMITPVDLHEVKCNYIYVSLIFSN